MIKKMSAQEIEALMVDLHEEATTFWSSEEESKNAARELNQLLKEKFVRVSDVIHFIDNQRDNGNLQPEKGFSPALCLSQLIKELENRV